eukprot:scaffold329_cov61-Phaeocystis_antarctica.AAC.3
MHGSVRRLEATLRHAARAQHDRGVRQPQRRIEHLRVHIACACSVCAGHRSEARVVVAQPLHVELEEVDRAEAQQRAAVQWAQRAPQHGHRQPVRLAAGERCDRRGREHRARRLRAAGLLLPAHVLGVVVHAHPKPLTRTVRRRRRAAASRRRPRRAAACRPATRGRCSAARAVQRRGRIAAAAAAAAASC